MTFFFFLMRIHKGQIATGDYNTLCPEHSMGWVSHLQILLVVCRTAQVKLTWDAILGNFFKVITVYVALIVLLDVTFTKFVSILHRDMKTVMYLVPDNLSCPTTEHPTCFVY